MSEEGDTEKARTEIARLRDAAEAVLTGAMGAPVQSRWNGNVLLDDSFGETISAVFRPDGTIAVAPHSIRRKFRWRVYLHELCHSFAAPVDRDVYNRMMGWEEGPVEMLQREIRKGVMRQAGIICDEAHIALCESFWPYNIYCETLQEMNAALEAAGVTPLDLTVFYYHLLQTPLGMRFLRLMRNISRIHRRGRRFRAPPVY